MDNTYEARRNASRCANFSLGERVKFQSEYFRVQLADPMSRLRHFPPNMVFFASRSPIPVKDQNGVKSFANMPGF